MKHYIITRFNLGAYHRANPVGPWMDGRIELFRRYTVKSMLAQTCKDFTWVILLDEATSKDHREAIYSSTRGLPVAYINVPYDDPNDANKKRIKREGHWVDLFATFISSTTCPEKELILTTRLDNDDLVRKDFVETLQKIAENQPEQTAIEYPYGIIYDGCNGKAWLTFNPGNQFISNVTSARSPRTAYWTTHGKVKAGSTKYIPVPGNIPGWIMMIHGGNWTGSEYLENVRAQCKDVTDDWPLLKKDFGIGGSPE